MAFRWQALALWLLVGWGPHRLNPPAQYCRRFCQLLLFLVSGRRLSDVHAISDSSSDNLGSVQLERRTVFYRGFLRFLFWITRLPPQISLNWFAVRLNVDGAILSLIPKFLECGSFEFVRYEVKLSVGILAVLVDS